MDALPLPPKIKKLVTTHMGTEADGVLRELNVMWDAVQAPEGEVFGRGPMTSYEHSLAEVSRTSTPPSGERTASNPGSLSATGIYDPKKLGQYNPNEVTFEQIELMRKNGMVRFVLGMRAMPIIGLFRNEPGEGWEIDCENEEVKAVVTAAFKRIVKDLVKDCQTARAFGFMAAEKVFRLISYGELGVEGYPDDKLAWVYKKVKPNHPKSVTVKRNAQTDRFEGYAQNEGASNEVKVRAEKAFIYSYRMEFGNPYGDPDSTPMFAPWYWLEFVWRALLRYTERLGTPVCVVYAPQAGWLKRSDGTKVHALDEALRIAMDIGKSSAAAMPSDNFDQSDGGGPKWRVDYLVGPERQGVFSSILDELRVELMRAGGIPEKAMGVSPDQTGAYAAWQIPSDMFLQAEETDLTEMVQAWEKYLLPQIAYYTFGEEWGTYGKLGLRTEGLDRGQIEALLEIAQTVLQAGHPDAMRVDLEHILTNVGVPMMPQAAQPAQSEPGRPEQVPPPSEGVQGEPATSPESPSPQQEGAIAGAEMTTHEVVVYMASREVQEHGHVTIKASSVEEFNEKAAVLVAAGVPATTPVKTVWTGSQEGSDDDSQAGTLSTEEPEEGGDGEGETL